MSTYRNGVLLNRARLLVTGQTTSYVDYDDGYYEKGMAKSYTVFTAGTFSGTTTIDLTHLVSTHIAFVKGTPDTLTSDTTNFTTLFVAGDVIPVSGSPTPGNNIAHTIAAGGVAAGTITLTSSNVLTSEVEGASITIKKREAHSNACVLDNNTGLMWSQTVAGKMGPASDGKLPWTTHANGYGIFSYCAAANVALLGGYGDWRIPNDIELPSLRDMEQPTAVPDAVAFPSWPTSAYVWSSTTSPGGATYGLVLYFANGDKYAEIKTVNHLVVLAREG